MKISNYFSSVLYRETGIRHLEKGKGCEDYVSTAYAPETGVKAVALSDGAGSYKNAAIGSEIVAAVAAKLFAEQFDHLYKLDQETASDYILQEVLQPLKELSHQNHCDLISYSATLLCTAMHPDGRYIVFHVGDGAIVGYSEKNGCETVSIYDHDGPANLTTFVTVEHTEYFMKKGAGDYITFVLMSDGPEDFLVNELGVQSRVKIMIQLAYFISEESMMEQIAGLVRLFKENGMGDDASFALLMDGRATPEVFEHLNSNLRMMLFGLDSDIGTKKLKRAYDVLTVLSQFPDGITCRQLYRKLHFHSKKIAKKKLLFMMEMELIKRENGKYYFLK